MSESRPPVAEPTPRVVVPAGTTAGTAVREAGLPGKGPDAVVVRPDGHIVASLHSDRHGAASLRQALLAACVTSPDSYKGASA